MRTKVAVFHVKNEVVFEVRRHLMHRLQRRHCRDDELVIALAHGI